MLLTVYSIYLHWYFYGFIIICEIIYYVDDEKNKHHKMQDMLNSPFYSFSELCPEIESISSTKNTVIIF